VQLRNIFRSNKLPHILATFQWAILILSLAFNVHFTVSVTGAVANGGLKVIMLFSVWMLFFSGILCALFYRIRKEGAEEKSIITLSILTALFSGANISLHFANDLILIMKATEVIAWALYNGTFFVSLYKISSAFLLPALRKDEEMKQREPRNERKLWA
jgi:hypothetical protein